MDDRRKLEQYAENDRRLCDERRKMAAEAVKSGFGIHITGQIVVEQKA